MADKNFITKTADKIKYYFVKWYKNSPVYSVLVVTGIISLIIILILFPVIENYFDNIEELESVSSYYEESLYKDEEKLNNLKELSVNEQWCIVKYAYNSADDEILRSYEYKSYNNKHDYTAFVKEFNRYRDTREYGLYTETVKNGSIVYEGTIKSRELFSSDIRPFNVTFYYNNEMNSLLYTDDNKTLPIIRQESYSMKEKETSIIKDLNNNTFNNSVSEGLLRHRKKSVTFNVFEDWFYVYPYLEYGIFEPVTIAYVWPAFLYKSKHLSVIDEIEKTDDVIEFVVKTYGVTRKEGNSLNSYIFYSRQRYVYEKCSSLIK